MATKTQTWKPDTCGCVIQETYDDADPGGTIDGTPITKCSVHASVSDGDHYGVIYSLPHGENRRKNVIYRELQKHPDLGDLGVDGEYLWKPGIAVTWTWGGTGADRVITVTLTGINLSGAKKTAIQNQLNTLFGAGRAVFVN